MSQEWAAQELAGINLGNSRLNKRFATLVDRLADKPTASIPHACNGWSETQAAYRFLAQGGSATGVMHPEDNQSGAYRLVDRGPSHAKLPCPARHVSASELCRQPGASITWLARRLDVGNGCVKDGQSPSVAQ